MTKDANKRPIDRIRDSAGSMDVGTPTEGAIAAMIDMGDSLYAIKERAIYGIQMADTVDPGRTNSAVPNTQQLLLSMGAQNPEVARIYLTAHTMLKAEHLGADFPEKRAWAIAFDYLKDIAAMIEIRSALKTAVEQAVSGFDGKVPSNRSFKLPSLGNAEQRCDAFAQKVGHAVDTLKTIARLFYPNELNKKWVDSLVSLAPKKHGENSALARFMTEVRANLLFMREMRNMIEHPKEKSCIKVHDFRLLPTMELAPPWIEIVQEGQDPISGPLESLMSQVIEELVTIGELFVMLLCGANITSRSGFPIRVIEMAPDRRASWNPHQRFFYGIEIHGELHKLG